MPRLPGLQEVGKINHHANAKNYTTANNQTIANERRNQWIMNTGCVDIRPKSTEWGNHPLYDYGRAMPHFGPKVRSPSAHPPRCGISTI